MFRSENQIWAILGGRRTCPSRGPYTTSSHCPQHVGMYVQMVEQLVGERSNLQELKRSLSKCHLPTQSVQHSKTGIKHLVIICEARFVITLVYAALIIHCEHASDTFPAFSSHQQTAKQSLISLQKACVRLAFYFYTHTFTYKFLCTHRNTYIHL